MDRQSGPDADVSVDAALVAALVAEQHPDLLAEVRPVAEGWDNAVFRLGRSLAVRAPRRRLGAELLAGELRWLPELADRLPLEVPVPVRAGSPAAGYPYHWSIVRWVPGTPLLEAGGDVDPAATGTALGRFCAALHRPAPESAPRNPWRGVPLAARAERLLERLATLPAEVERRAVVHAWQRALDAPAWTGDPRWLHGDLHPANVIVRAGRVAGVIDFGDLTAGDPATDLSVAWMLPGFAARHAVRAAYGRVDHATWERARGNALAHAVAVLADGPRSGPLPTMALDTLRRVLADTAPGAAEPPPDA